MKATKQEIVAALHSLAHWIDRHDIPGESIVMLNVDGWADPGVHLSPEAFAERGLGPLGDDGHGMAFLDGVCVVTCDHASEEVPAESGQRVMERKA